MSKTLLSCDLNCCRITKLQYDSLLDRIRANLSQSDSIDIHLYNYIERKHTFIQGGENVTLHPYLGSHKRVTLDLNQALDCVIYPHTVDCDAIYILCGEYDSDCLFEKLATLHCPVYKIYLSASNTVITPIKTKHTRASDDLTERRKPCEQIDHDTACKIADISDTLMRKTAISCTTLQKNSTHDIEHSATSLDGVSPRAQHSIDARTLCTDILNSNDKDKIKDLVNLNNDNDINSTCYNIGKDIESTHITMSKHNTAPHSLNTIDRDKLRQIAKIILERKSAI